MSDHCSGPADADGPMLSKTIENVPPSAYYGDYDAPCTASSIDSSHRSTRVHVSMQETRPLLPPRVPKQGSVTCTSDHLVTFVKIILAWVIVYVVYSRIITTEVEHYKALYDGARVEAEHYKTLYGAIRVEAEHYKTLSDVTHVEAERCEILYKATHAQAESVAKAKLVLEDQVNQLWRSLRGAKVSTFWEMVRMLDTNMDVWVGVDDPGARPKCWSHGITSGKYNSNVPPVTSTKTHFTTDQAVVVESTKHHRIVGYKVTLDKLNNGWWTATGLNASRWTTTGLNAGWWTATGLNRFGQAGPHQVKFSAKAPAFGSAEYDVDIFYAEWKG